MQVIYLLLLVFLGTCSCITSERQSNYLLHKAIDPTDQEEVNDNQHTNNSRVLKKGKHGKGKGKKKGKGKGKANGKGKGKGKCKSKKLLISAIPMLRNCFEGAER